MKKGYKLYVKQKDYGNSLVARQIKKILHKMCYQSELDSYGQKQNKS